MAAQMIQPGVTTDEIDKAVHEATIAAGMQIYISFWHIKFLFSLLPFFLSTFKKQ